MSDEMPPPMVTLRLKIWNETTGEVIAEVTTDTTEGNAIAFIRNLSASKDMFPPEHQIDILKTTGERDWIIDITLRRLGVNKNTPGRFEALFRQQMPRLALPGPEDVGGG